MSFAAGWIKTANTAECSKVQRELFAMGFRWDAGACDVMSLPDGIVLFLSKGKRITWGRKVEARHGVQYTIESVTKYELVPVPNTLTIGGKKYNEADVLARLADLPEVK